VSDRTLTRTVFIALIACASLLAADRAPSASPSPAEPGNGGRGGSAIDRTAKPAAAEYAGNAACQRCHAAEWDSFYKNPHFKSLASGKESPEITGCEGCHGPLKAHVEEGEHASKDTVPNVFPRMKPSEIVAACLKCHAQDFNRANIRRSEHTQHDVACTACHSNHHPTTPRFLLAKSEPESCYQCHSDVRAQFDMPSKHRVNEGFMKCSDCHNPHGGFTPTFGMGQTSKMLNQSHNNDQPCLKCHVEKRGPFVFEHETGQEDGCISCHKPHGSTSAKLLTRPAVAELCLECHTGNGDFGVKSNRGVTYPDHATHSMTDPHYQRCTSCHVTIHGSNVHYRFLR
jgi:DmsE family decaheme c-type cytochrome